MLTRLRPKIPPAFRYPAYRAYWLGSVASVTGYQVLYFTESWLAYDLTGSALYIGYVGVAQGVPAIVLNLYGGVLADRLDKRRLILWTQVIIASLIFTVGALTLLDVVRAWHLVVVAFLAGAVGAFESPARQSLYPHLIDRDVLTSAVAMNSTIWQGTRIPAPAIAGLVISLLGVAAAFFVAGMGLLIMAGVMLGLRVPRIETQSSGSPIKAIFEGLNFIKADPIFSFLISMTFFNSFFGMAYSALMPIFARDVLAVGADGQGWLLSANGIGSIAVVLWLGTRGESAYKGLILIGGATLFGLTVLTFALTSKYVGSYGLALGLMVLAGGFNSAYTVSAMSSLQMLVPDHMRGRVMGFYGMTWSIFPLGVMQASALAGWIGAPFAVAIGSSAVSGFALGPAMLNRRIRGLGSIVEAAVKRSKGQPDPD